MMPSSIARSVRTIETDHSGIHCKQLTTFINSTVGNMRSSHLKDGCTLGTLMIDAILGMCLMPIKSTLQNTGATRVGKGTMVIAQINEQKSMFQSNIRPMTSMEEKTVESS